MSTPFAFKSGHEESGYRPFQERERLEVLPRAPHVSLQTVGMRGEAFGGHYRYAHFPMTYRHSSQDQVVVRFARLYHERIVYKREFLPGNLWDVCEMSAKLKT